jgi:ComF family protein
VALHVSNSYLTAFVDLFFPRLCKGCGVHLFENEQEICKKCLRSLPRTGFELIDDNPAEKIFWGRVNIEKAVSVYYYRKGELLQQLLHKLKYRGHPLIGEELGKTTGNILRQTGCFNNIDALIPVPLHPKKQRIRGYNQSKHIAYGISLVSDIPLLTGNLVRTVHTSSQTTKNRFERWENVSNIFSVLYPEKLNNKHILLIDDVVTTGATLESCARALQKSCDLKISIATIGFADH